MHRGEARPPSSNLLSSEAAHSRSQALSPVLESDEALSPSHSSPKWQEASEASVRLHAILCFFTRCCVGGGDACSARSPLRSWGTVGTSEQLQCASPIGSGSRTAVAWRYGHEWLRYDLFGTIYILACAAQLCHVWCNCACVLCRRKSLLVCVARAD